MLVVDLFSGLGGFSEGFARRGHDVFRVDWNHEFETDLRADIRTVRAQELPTQPDWVVASPPCERFSVASVGHYWNHGYNPLTEAALDNVRAAVQLIEELKPRWWLIENPRGMLRKLDLIPWQRWETTLCRYGAGRMKPTDFWGHVPENFRFRTPCTQGDWCHPPSPRGSHQGTQRQNGFSKAERAKLPLAFSLSLLRASQADLGEDSLLLR